MTKRSNGKAPQATLSKKGVGDHGRATGGKAENAQPVDGWVTLRDASDHTGVSISTLRNWYRKGLIDSRVEKGPNGSQRIVRLDEVVARTRAPADPSPPAAAPVAARPPSGSPAVFDGASAASLGDLIAAHAAACERAGRAEARAEYLEREIDELRVHLASNSSERYKALEAENQMLRQRLELLRAQAEDMARRLSFIEGEPDEIDLSDDAPRIPPPEEDEFLPLTQRVRVRHKRKRAARRQARRAAKAASSSSSSAS